MSQVKIGVCVYIFNQNNQVLLGLRKSLHANGSWCPPGGHLEYGETAVSAAVREVSEETGLTVNESDVIFAGYTDDFFNESGKQYVTIHFMTTKYLGVPEVLETDKCAQWEWFSLNELPGNLMLPNINFLKKYPDVLSDFITKKDN